MRFHEHVRSAEPFWRLEFVTGEFDLEPIGIVEIDRVHEPAIPLDELDASLAQASRRVCKGGSRHVERDVLDTSDFSWRVSFRILARFIREHRQQPAVPGIEVEVTFIRFTEVRLLEDEWHAE